MGKIIEIVHCLCGEPMKKEVIENGVIPVCWKCQCDNEYELNRKSQMRKQK